VQQTHPTGGTAERILAAAGAGKAFHAHLVHGPKGVGKGTFAARVSAALLCGKPGSPCGDCPACTMAAAGTHPDMLVIQPDEAGTVKIKAIRSLLEELSKRSFYGGWRTITIHEAETMTTEAQNCLLKTLEDPPDKACFFLLAVSPEAMLPTIRSRCVPVRMEAMAESELIALLCNAGADAQEAALIAALSERRPGTALELLADKKGEGRLWRIRDSVLGLVLGFKGLGGLPKAQDLFKTLKEDAGYALDCLASFWRDMLLVKCGCGEIAPNTDALPKLARACETFTKSMLNDMIDLVSTAKRQLDANVNYALVIDALFIGASEVMDEQNHRGHPL
jgi:DNA polymerase III subunit delta'